MSLAVGDKLGPYEVLRLIGAGGMGEVYKARDTRLDRLVAIKTSTERFTERFAREARTVAALNHPNICTVHDVGPDYLVMEYVEGTPVKRVEDPRKLLDIATQIADGLQAAHAAGIVHRDLKPDNILITGDGRIKVLDFGVAKNTARTAESDATVTISVTQPGTVVGTVAYMSPEQAQGLSDVDARSDQFSFGLVLYELAAGRRAFERRNPAELMTAIIREDPEPLPPTIPHAMRWVIERCLAKDPEQRYYSTRDLYLELRQMPARLSGTFEGEAPVGRRLHLWAAALAPVCLIVGFLLAAMLPIPASGPGRATPFATEGEVQTMPAWSTKGDRLAYVADINGIMQVFTKQVGGAARTQLTRHDSSCMDPFWSADGTRVYYIANGASGPDLWSISVAGGPPEKVLSGVSRAALSPDGRTLAVLARQPGGLYRLAFSSPPGTTPRPYAQEPVSKFRVIASTGGGSLQFLQFTADSRHLGFYTDAAGRVQFWKIPMDGRPPEPEPLGKNPQTTPTRFTWLPGGRGFITGTEGARASAPLWIWDFSRATQQALTNGAGNEGFPAVSLDGRVLAYSAGTRGYDIVEIPLDGSAPRDVLATSRMEVAPSVTPDGMRFAYVTDRSGADEIWLRDRRDGSERLIVGHGQTAGDEVHLIDCDISPDGSRLAYRRTQAGSIQIWIAPLSGDSSVPLWNDPDLVFQRGPAWSPDGNWIAYYSTRDGKNAVLKARVGGDTRPGLVAYTGSAQPVRWSPRGDWIAFQDTKGLRIVSPDGKQDRAASSRQWLTYGWSADGLALYGIASLETRRLLLARIDLATGRETKLADLGLRPAAMDFGLYSGSFEYRGFSLEPGGKSFLTSTYRARTDIWLLNDFENKTRLLDWLRRASYSFPLKTN